MNLVDSSGWLEYFANGEHAKFFATPVEDLRNLIVPSICLYEVFKKVLKQKTENDALLAVAAMQQGRVIALDETIALNAAKLSHKLKVHMADSIILSTARAF